MIESDPVDLASVRRDDMMLIGIASGDPDLLDYSDDRSWSRSCLLGVRM